jgi:hypothetical protein
MTNYKLKPLTTFPSLASMEKKAARKKLLEEIKTPIPKRTDETQAPRASLPRE